MSGLKPLSYNGYVELDGHASLAMTDSGLECRASLAMTVLEWPFSCG
ncbi:hypothetical protein [Limnohabitans sp. DM1]|nr:hypothetical protein [Limnohabitans sp. DM1]